MRIDHIGPPRARLGGPAGYLEELARAAAASPDLDLEELAREGVRVILPPPRSAAPAAAAPSAAPPSSATQPTALQPSTGRRLRTRLRPLLKPLLGPLLRPFRGKPRFFRHSAEELATAGGALDAHFREAREGVLGETRASLEGARLGQASGADVLFCHDPFSAEVALEKRSAGQEVWLLIHAPMPLPLYLAWSWGVPEWPWERFLTLPDVRTWIDRELATIETCDRVLLPCPEAAEELARVDPRFGPALARADYLLTGAAGTVGTADPNSLTAAEKAARRAETRRRLRLPLDEPIALYLGNPQPYRGLDALVAALDHLPRRRQLPGRLAVAGPNPASLPGHRRLVALGRVSDVSSLLASVDFVVNTNRLSLFDLSTIEATQAGCPLLLHATGGNKTFQRLGAGCRMVQSLAPEEIARGLAEMLALDHEELSALGDASRRCYEEHLTPAWMWRRHAELYRQAAAARSHRAQAPTLEEMPG